MPADEEGKSDKTMMTRKRDGNVELEEDERFRTLHSISSLLEATSFFLLLVSLVCICYMVEASGDLVAPDYIGGFFLEKCFTAFPCLFSILRGFPV